MSHVPAERCLSIVQLLAEDAGAMSLRDIAEELDLPKSGVHRLLSTLVDIGWVEKDEATSLYRLTMRLAIVGQRFYLATGIPDVCQPVLDRLARESREFVRLAVVDGDHLVWVAHAQGASVGLVYQPSIASDVVPLHATATGKVWLASMPNETATRLALANQRFGQVGQHGPNVVRTLETLLSAIETTRAAGYGVAVNEGEPGVSAVAVPVFADDAGRVVGTVSVAGPSIRMTRERLVELVPMLREVAATLANVWPLRQRPSAAPAATGESEHEPRRIAR
ncbi:IclR family transcriptional regulator [Acuticoccus kandeliae]|uniref:IclR family transcriptional regulator n=1 Tax=Acuticoccus kandeliae TaxID=2073160 RepID=UPI000D3E866C|nr:IclR family transcriptional regulator [Acuticoccus kandeliae]